MQSANAFETPISEFILSYILTCIYRARLPFFFIEILNPDWCYFNGESAVDDKNNTAAATTNFSSTVLRQNIMQEKLTKRLEFLHAWVDSSD